MRVGNGAWNQQQIDVYGELLDAAHRLADQLARHRRRRPRAFLVACADTAAVRWREPDQGIWEVRGEPRHFLYSKVMCWVALDRAHRAGRPARTPRTGSTAGRATRDEIRETVLERGLERAAPARSPSPSAPTSWTRRT